MYLREGGLGQLKVSYFQIYQRQIIDSGNNYNLLNEVCKYFIICNLQVLHFDNFQINYDT